jgi:hypothetical protein
MMNLSAALFAAFAAIWTQGSIPKWFTILLWCLTGLNLGLFLFN